MFETNQLATLKLQISEKRNSLKLRLEQDALCGLGDKTQGDEVDRANQEENKQLLLNRRQHDLEYLRQLNLALARAESDDFGYCEHCGESISLARLQARPESRLCVDCQQHQELRILQTGI